MKMKSTPCWLTFPIVTAILTLSLSANESQEVILDSPSKTQSTIDRTALVERHNVHITAWDPLDSLTVGNGKFAFTVDATGLQTFPAFFEKGVCLGTQSEWGWHSHENVEAYERSETYRYYEMEGRKVPYSVQGLPTERGKAAANYFRQNPHRLHLGILGFEFTLKSGEIATTQDIKIVEQTLDLWNGVIHSHFLVDGKEVKVETLCDPEDDTIAVRVHSDWLTSGRLKVIIRYPFPSTNHTDSGCNWDPKHHQEHGSEIISIASGGATLLHQLGATKYQTKLQWEQPAQLMPSDGTPHRFVITPAIEGNVFSFTCEFTPEASTEKGKSFNSIQKQSIDAWQAFWNSGGAIDFTGSTDLRANELERRIVLSQYLARVQTAGNYPPQETGMTFNSWYGKFHLEMHWWHGLHWALWNRGDLLERSLNWYESVIEVARSKAKLQGYEGVRWAKMTDPSSSDSPSGIGEYLIWQQPHIIYFAELIYCSNPTPETLEKYAKVVTATADFMADFPVLNPATGQYDLPPPLIPAQERLPRGETSNPAFELRYWKWGLEIAQKWRERTGLNPSEHYQMIIDHLADLPQKEGLYLAAESAPDSYTNDLYMGDHPMVLGAVGMLPMDSTVDPDIAEATYQIILDKWDWPSTWGWDYPMMAMAATRLGNPDWAIDALLMDMQKNTYLANGHNYQDERLRIYMPGNGGLLSAVAMMCAGFQGCETPNPGFPEEGWTVRWENLSPMF